MSITNLIRFNNLWGDIFGGVTAAVVSLPLALAFGVASGVVPLVGCRGQFVSASLPLCLVSIGSRATPGP
ncbi:MULTISPECIES: SulP family inorganic anion transporter [unclassified Phormidesmis]